MNELRNDAVLWLTGEMMDTSGRWGLVGIYTTEQEAVNNATTRMHFVGPVKVGVTVSGNAWPGSYYPIARAERAAKTKREERKNG